MFTTISVPDSELLQRGNMELVIDIILKFPCQLNKYLTADRVTTTMGHMYNARGYRA